MNVYSYTKSPSLINLLDTIEQLRQRLLLTPVSPADKRKIRWETNIDRIYYALHLEGEQVTRTEIIDLLSPLGKKATSSKAKHILQIRRSLDFLYNNWLVSEKSITTHDVIAFYKSVYDGKLRVSEEELSTHLQYIQIKPDHPLVQFALTYIVLRDLKPFTSENNIFAYFVSLMFLYKSGYEFMGLISLVEYFYNHLEEYDHLIDLSIKQSNITSWMEFVMQAALHQLNSILNTITNKTLSHERDEFFSLNERQQAILSYLENPEVKISNREIQKRFKISQITASRDLAKLASLRLIFALGKGRSTYYTKM